MPAAAVGKGRLDENPDARRKPKVKPSGNPKITHAANPDIDIDSLSDRITARNALEAETERATLGASLGKTAGTLPPDRL
ncbi:hypothetical protein [Erwinia mallotivora]|uniref:hypothetical protein n=1 Tax=Erwinia mallotivora TaxID=69222 RepID=UPI0021C06A52|nr:hypothetical protein [Erwinia mallotivora]